MLTKFLFKKQFIQFEKISEFQKKKKQNVNEFDFFPTV